MNVTGNNMRPPKSISKRKKKKRKKREREKKRIFLHLSCAFYTLKAIEEGKEGQNISSVFYLSFLFGLVTSCVLTKKTKNKNDCGESILAFLKQAIFDLILLGYFLCYTSNSQENWWTFKFWVVKKTTNNWCINLHI